MTNDAWLHYDGEPAFCDVEDTPFDRRILAQALHAEKVGAGGLSHCFHGTDGSECHYHAELIARQYERIFRERPDYWLTTATSR